MPTVFVAGSTGYLGRYLCAEYRKRGWNVRALVRNEAKARVSGLEADEIVEAEATKADSLTGIMANCDLVISALGITRQKDGLTYRDVDYQANVNLLEEAMRANVGRFAYIHVLNGDKIRNCALVGAKQDFVDHLTAANIASTVIAPSGYFSDMGDFLKMAQSGRVWLFGTGAYCINPIDGSDLAGAVADVIEEGREWLDVGGPDIYSHLELAQLAFDACGKPRNISRLPDSIRRLLLWLLPRILPLSIYGPIQFFLSALSMDMIGEKRGEKRLKDYFDSKI